MTIAAMAPRARVEARALYRHFAKLLRGLRRQMQALGIDSTTVKGVLDETPHDFECALDMQARPAPFRGLEPA